jgi:hypothetical protein
MSKPITHENVEQKIFRLSIFQDGIWDMQLGGTIMLFSFYPVTRSMLGVGWNLVLLFGLLALLIIGGATLKRNFSKPRIGLVRFGIKQQSKIRVMRLVIFTIFLASSTLAITLIMQVFQGPAWGEKTPEWLQVLDMDIVFGLVAVAIFSLLSVFFRIWRPFIYGLLLGSGLVASGALTVYQGTELHYPFAIAGGIILVIGIGSFIQFLRTYQVPAEEA